MSECVTHFACDCITEKLIKFEKAEAENKVLREALEFYGDLDSWGHINMQTATYTVILEDEGAGDFDNGRGTDDSRVGGLRARQALADAEKIKNGTN